MSNNADRLAALAPRVDATGSLETLGVVPIGGIVMWSGSLAEAADLSPVWEICNGTDNAPGPDLRDKFIVGAKQDDSGVAKTNIEGSLKVSATQTGATLANHAGLTHTGGAVGNHTGLTHDGAVASHPDLTHAALSHPALTVVHADHSVASASHTHASGADVSIASATGSDASSTGASAAGVNSFASGTNRSGLTALPTHSHASQTHSHAAVTASRPSLTGSAAAVTLTHADHSLASLSHQAIGTHANLTHAFTPPADHGSSGTVTHSVTQADAHAISAHGTVAIVPAYYALGFIQRMQ